MGEPLPRYHNFQPVVLVKSDGYRKLNVLSVASHFRSNILSDAIVLRFNLVLIQPTSYLTAVCRTGSYPRYR